MVHPDDHSVLRNHLEQLLVATAWMSDNRPSWCGTPSSAPTVGTASGSRTAASWCTKRRLASSPHSRRRRRNRRQTFLDMMRMDRPCASEPHCEVSFLRLFRFPRRRSASDGYAASEFANMTMHGIYARPDPLCMHLVRLPGVHCSQRPPTCYSQDQEECPRPTIDPWCRR